MLKAENIIHQGQIRVVRGIIAVTFIILIKDLKMVIYMDHGKDGTRTVQKNSLNNTIKVVKSNQPRDFFIKLNEILYKEINCYCVK